MAHGLFDSHIADLRARIDTPSRIAQGNGTPVSEAVAGLQAAPAGFVEHLAKPTSPDRIAAAIQRVIESSSHVGKRENGGRTWLSR